MATKTIRTGSRLAAMPGEQVRTQRDCALGTCAPELCAGMLVLALGLLSGSVIAEEPMASVSLSATGEYSFPPVEPPVQSAMPAQKSASASTPIPAPPIDSALKDKQRAYFGDEPVSREARQIADWIVDSTDNKGLPFVIVDKVDAKVFVFDNGGRIHGAAPALLGLARGDDSVPGIGDRAFADMPPETRTTPAGRFVASLGMDTSGKDVLWVDYEAAVSLHRVVTNKPMERRLARLATPTPLDNRISYGCINVPKRFYEEVVSPAFTGTHGIVYVLPETRPAREFFGAYNVEERFGRNYAGRTQAPR